MAKCLNLSAIYIHAQSCSKAKRLMPAREHKKRAQSGRQSGRGLSAGETGPGHRSQDPEPRTPALDHFHHIRIDGRR